MEFLLKNGCYWIWLAYMFIGFGKQTINNNQFHGMLRVFFLSIRLAVFTLGIEGLTVQFVGAWVPIMQMHSLL